MSYEDGILCICSGADVCGDTCFHGIPHKHTRACDLPCNKETMEGNRCSKQVFAFYVDKNHAQELNNVINMALCEGEEYGYTNDLAKKLTEFINGGV